MLRKGAILTEGLRVAAICDTKADRLDKAASGRRATTRLPLATIAIRSRGVDAVPISTPCILHLALTAILGREETYRNSLLR